MTTLTISLSTLLDQELERRHGVERRRAVRLWQRHLDNLLGQNGLVA
jgi:hypothetical protein